MDGNRYGIRLSSMTFEANVEVIWPYRVLWPFICNPLIPLNRLNGWYIWRFISLITTIIRAYIVLIMTRLFFHVGYTSIFSSPCKQLQSNTYNRLLSIIGLRLLTVIDFDPISIFHLLNYGWSSQNSLQLLKLRSWRRPPCWNSCLTFPKLEVIFR